MIRHSMMLKREKIETKVLLELKRTKITEKLSEKRLREMAREIVKRQLFDPQGPGAA